MTRPYSPWMKSSFEFHISPPNSVLSPGPRNRPMSPVEPVTAVQGATAASVSIQKHPGPGGSGPAIGGDESKRKFHEP
jgi:hypothetical protein